MSKNSNYVGATQTLGVEDRNLDNIIFHPTKPVLDSELNLINDINSSKLQDAIRSKVPSGWLDADYSIGNDNSAMAYGINTLNDRTDANTRKTLFINSRKALPTLAAVNGWIIPVGGTNSTSDAKIKITLPDAPVNVGYRTDLVFLEVWKAEIAANPSAINKPSGTKIYKFGNVQYGDPTKNLDEEIINPNVGFATTSRVQIQYRVRVVADVDFYNTPEGLDDQIKVFAQGSNLIVPTSSTAYNVFSNGKDSFDDCGLYVAGDGSDLAMEELGTVDGYVYAIPMLKIHRRNKVAFSLGNLNGSGVTIFGTVPSDRPDNLFYDEINALDIEDLRHAVSFNGFNTKEILDQTYNDICSGNLKTCLTENQSSGSIVARTNINFKVDRLSSTGDNIIAQPNGQRRYFSDVQKAKDITTKVVAPGSWASGSQVSINVEPPFPSGCIIGPAITVKAIIGGVVTPVNYQSLTFFGSSASFEISASNPGLIGNSQDIFVTYQIIYPQVGNPFSKPITEALRVVYNNSYNWGYVSVNDIDNTAPSFPKRKKINFVPKYTSFGSANGYKDYAYTYKFTDGDNRYGVGTLVSIFEKGNSTVFHNIPGNIVNTKDLAYVLSVYDVDHGVYLSVDGQQRNPSTGEIQVQVNSAASLGSGNTIRFDVVVVGGNIEYDERTKTLEDMAEVKFFSIKGNNTNEIFLKGCLPVGNSDDPDNLVIGVQSLFNGSSYQTWCYLDNYYIGCTASIEDSFVKLTFSAPVLSTSQIDIALLLYKALTDVESMDVYYNYKEYKGIVNRIGFGSSPASYIKSKVVFQNDQLDVVTCGTGAINTAETLPKSYEPLIPLLPLASGVEDGIFTGTLHDKRIITGGSYTIGGSYNTPYVTGKENYFSNDGGYRSRGSSTGGTSTSTAEFKSGVDSGVNRLVVGKLVEMVLEDGTKNFLPGELALKVETNYMDDTSVKNRITNSDSLEGTNSFDMFKVKGRPLLKVKSK